MRILAIGGHPDDMEIQCGGTLALYSKLGHEVYIYHGSDGGKCGINKTSEKIITERRKEAINSAKIINAVSLGGNVTDTEFTLNLESRLTILEIIKKCNPDLIFTHHPGDYHPDHINIGKIVIEANCVNTLTSIKKSSEVARPPKIYFIENFSGLNFLPEEYVDISEVFDTKLKMIEEHESQVQIFMECSGMDLIDFVKTNGKYRGYQCGVKYAEAFIEHKMYPRSTSSRSLP